MVKHPLLDVHRFHWKQQAKQLGRFDALLRNQLTIIGGGGNGWGDD